MFYATHDGVLGRVCVLAENQSTVPVNKNIPVSRYFRMYIVFANTEPKIEVESVLVCFVKCKENTSCCVCTGCADNFVPGNLCACGKHVYFYLFQSVQIFFHMKQDHTLTR